MLYICPTKLLFAFFPRVEILLAIVYMYVKVKFLCKKPQINISANVQNKKV